MAGADSWKSPPSPRRIAEARREGQLPISHLLNSSLSFFACCCLATTGAGWAVAFIVAGVRSTIDNAISGQPFLHLLRGAWIWGLEALIYILAPICALGWGAFVLSAVFQTRGRFRLTGTKSASLHSGRLRPIVVVVALFVVGATTLYGSRSILFGAAQRGAHLHASALFLYFGTLTQLLLFRLGATSLFLAIADSFWQWRRWHQRLRMSRAEVDEEHRLLHGDPLLFAERQRLGRQ